MDKIHQGFPIAEGRCTTIRWSISGGFRGSPLMYLVMRGSNEVLPKSRVGETSMHGSVRGVGE